MTIYEFLTVVYFTCMGFLTGIHISYGMYLQKYGKRFPKVRWLLTMIVFFILVFLLRFALHGVDDDSKIHWLALPLGAAVAIIAYKVNIKRLKNKKAQSGRLG
ncbi:MAG: hypothetical protein R6X06_05555 [Gammaproteobacteria bacterium]